MLNRMRTGFYGADTCYRQVNGEQTRRVYLDSAASCLMLKPAYEASLKFLEHYSNTHSDTHNSAIISNKMYEWAHEQVLRFVNADPDEYTCIFVGSGSTAAINRVARILSVRRSDKTGVLISLMEHHSFAEHIGCLGEGVNLGSLDLPALESSLVKYDGKINYVAVTAASNVTGVVNPIHDMARIAHAHDALTVVDASQILAHRALSVRGKAADRSEDIDVLVFSGHKVYAPGSPGVLVIRRALLESTAPVEFGGGMVDRVFKTEYTVTGKFPDREEAGTPNILGAVTLGMSLDIMSRIGMDVIERHEMKMLRRLFRDMKRIPGITIYGDTDLDRFSRTATISFNLAGVDHGLLAAILNDYFNLALRNECFCAHPYVREMILQQLWDLDPDLSEAEVESKKGMVRASFGLNNDMNDVTRLVNAWSDIAGKKDWYLARYRLAEDGTFKHDGGAIDWNTYFCPFKALESVL
ncbi:MAG: aminotransferase class V-fold PLP-dependent enzyme [Exilibacterium sp.]